MTPFLMFDDRPITNFITPPSASAPHLSNLVRQSGCSLLGTSSKFKLCKPCKVCGKPPTRPALITIKDEPVSYPYMKSFQGSFEYYYALPRKTYTINNAFYILLVNMWHLDIWTKFLLCWSVLLLCSGFHGNIMHQTPFFLLQPAGEKHQHP